MIDILHEKGEIKKMTKIKFKHENNWYVVFMSVIESKIRIKILSKYKYITKVDYKRLSAIITRLYAKPIHPQNSLYQAEIDLDKILKILLDKYHPFRIAIK